MRVSSTDVAKHSSRRRRLMRALATGAAATALALGSSAGTANAAQVLVYLKHGSDWASFDVDGYIKICDEEADGRPAYAYLKMETGEDRTYTDGGGADGVCAGTDATGYVAGVDYIKVCERINNWPDSCSDRAYITYGD